MAYQWVLRKFGQFTRIHLEPPLPLREALFLGLAYPESGLSQREKDGEKIANQLATVLESKGKEEKETMRRPLCFPFSEEKETVLSLSSLPTLSSSSLFFLSHFPRFSFLTLSSLSLSSFLSFLFSQPLCSTTTLASRLRRTAC